ncbi:MAG: hypothetical protein K6B39_10245 [Lachnospiraceae bacterium]|nr:hypothetical protein [Lachnospiraceae bacterium]
MNVMVLVNKDFEYAGYTKGMESRLRSGDLKSLKLFSQNPGVGPGKFTPSAIYKLGPHVIREFCIAYLFGENENTSNSELKYCLLKQLIAAEKPDFIISVSTSESTPDAQGLDTTNSVNGCVFLGAKFYAKDCREFDPTTKSSLKIPDGWFAESKSPAPDLCAKVYEKKYIVSMGMEPMRNSSAGELAAYADSRNQSVSLGVINVMDYSKYEDADPATYEEFTKRGGMDVPIGLETTHAVVKLAADDIFGAEKQFPVLFVSPIVDRYKSFGTDVDDKWGLQNAIGSFNAGVVTANMLDKFPDVL